MSEKASYAGKGRGGDQEQLVAARAKAEVIIALADENPALVRRLASNPEAVLRQLGFDEAAVGDAVMELRNESGIATEAAALPCTWTCLHTCWWTDWWVAARQ
jgi:hypothetical protein